MMDGTRRAHRQRALVLFASAQPEPPKNLDMVSRATATYFDIPNYSKPTSRPRRREQRMEREASRAPKQMLCVKFGRRPIKDTLPKPGKLQEEQRPSNNVHDTCITAAIGNLSLRLPKKRKELLPGHVARRKGKEKKGDRIQGRRTWAQTLPPKYRMFCFMGSVRSPWPV